MIENIDEIKKKYMDDPENELKALNYGKALLRAHLNEDALQIFLNINSDEHKEEALFQAGKAYFYIGDLDKSEELYKKLMGTKYEGRASYELSQIYIQKISKIKNKKINKDVIKKLKVVVYEYLNKSIESKPTFKAYLSLINQLYLDSKFEDALKYCYVVFEHDEWASAKTPNNYYIKFKMAEIFYKQEKFEKSKEILEQLLNSEYKNKQQLYKLMGLVYVKEKNICEAKKMIILLHDDFEASDLYYRYARLCVEKQDFDEAILYFTKCNNSFMKYQSIHQLAKLYSKIGFFEEAKKYYNLMLDGNEKDRNIAYLGIASSERLARNYQKALEILNNIKNPNIQDKCELLLEKYKINCMLGNIEKAEAYMDELLKINYNGFGFFEYAKLKVRKKEYDEALEILKDITSKDNTYDWIAVEYIGKVYKYKDNYDLAKKYFNSIPETSLDAYYEALGDLIECALEENDIVLAEKYLVKLESAKKIKAKEKFYYYKGITASKNGDYKTAMLYLEKVKLNDIRDFAATELVKIYIKKYNAIDKAKKCIEELMNGENVVSKSQAYYLYGLMYLELRDYEKAKEYLNYNVVNNNFRKEDSLVLIANCEEMCHNYDNAVKIYLSLRQSSNNLFSLGKCYMKAERYDEAKEVFNGLIASNKSNKNEALLRIAIIEYKMKNYDSALEILETLYNTPLEYSAKIWQAKTYKVLNDNDRASLILQGLLKTNNRIYALLELVILEYDRCNLKIALDYVEQLINEGTKKDINIGYYHKGKIYQKSGLYDKARECFLKILNVDDLCNFKVDEEMILKDKIIDIDKNTIFLELGSIEECLRNFKEAKKYYRMIEKENSNWKYAMKSLIGIKTLERKYEEAEALIKELEDRNFSDEALLAKGKYFCYRNLYKEARISLRDVSDKNYKEAIYLIAKTYLYEGNVTKCNSMFDQLVQASGDSLYYIKLFLNKLSYITKENSNRKIYEMYKNEIPESLLKLICLNIFENKLYEAFKDALVLFEIPEYTESAINILTYLSKELNIILDEKYYGISSYIRSQIINYDKSYASRHIKNDMNFMYQYSFNPEIDINLLIEIIGPLLNEENFVYNNFLDMYVIPFENVGVNGEKYLAVQTLPKSNNIVKMYPISSRFKEDDTDIVLTKSLS